MARGRIKMSKTLAAFSSAHPLQLDFFQADSFRRRVNGWVHRKTVPYTILAQVIEGRYEVRCGGSRERVEAGGVVSVGAHAPVEFIHRDGPSGMMEVRWLHLAFNISGQIDLLGCYELPLRLSDKDAGIIGELIAQAVEAAAILPKETPARLLKEHAVATAVAGILCQPDRLRPEASSRGIRTSRFAGVLARIRENLAAPLSVKELAQVAGLSEARFYDLFKEEFGVTPMRYVRAVRLEAAARLLATSDAKLAWIAEVIGFADAFHFSHAFKIRFGVSPREYRTRAGTLYP